MTVQFYTNPGGRLLATLRVNGVDGGCLDRNFVQHWGGVHGSRGFNICDGILPNICGCRAAAVVVQTIRCGPAQGTLRARFGVWKEGDN